MIAALALAAVLPASVPVSASTETAADGTVTLIHELLVDAEAADVWAAIGTAEGWKSWAAPVAWAPAADIIETSYNKAATPGDPTTIKQQVVMRIPGRLFAFRTVKAPQGFPDFETYRKVDNAIELEPVGDGRTRIRLTSAGYPPSDAGKRLARFFEAGNKLTLAQLGARFQSAPAPDGPLQPLSFLVGHCWRGEFKGSGAVDTHCFTPIYGGKHVRDVHEVTGGKEIYRGETIFSWNREAKKVEFVYFNSLGGVSKGGVKPGTSELVFDDEVHMAQDGKKISFSTVWRRVGSDSYDAITKGVNSASGERVVRYTRVK